MSAVNVTVLGTGTVGEHAVIKYRVLEDGPLHRGPAHESPLYCFNTTASDNVNSTSGSGQTGFSDVLGVWVTGACCLVGMAGNLLSFVVLLRAFRRSPMFLVLRAVALSDTLFLASVLLLQTLVNMHPFTGLLHGAFAWRGHIQWIVWPLLMMTQMSTVWLTVLVSVERYIAICFPLHSAALLSLSRLRRAVAAVILCSVFFNVPRYWEYSVVAGTPSQLVRSAVGENPVYRYLYMCALYTLLLFLLPLALLVVLNAKLVLALRTGRRKWRTLHSHQRREQSLTSIPLAIVLVFGLCGTPALIVNVLEAMRPGLATLAFLRFLVVANLLVVLNSAANFVIYCLLGRRFRAQLLALFCPRTRTSKHVYCSTSDSSRAHQQDTLRMLDTSRSRHTITETSTRTK